MLRCVRQRLESAGGRGRGGKRTPGDPAGRSGCHTTCWIPLRAAHQALVEDVVMRENVTLSVKRAGGGAAPLNLPPPPACGSSKACWESEAQTVAGGHFWGVLHRLQPSGPAQLPTTPSVPPPPPALDCATVAQLCEQIAAGRRDVRRSGPPAVCLLTGRMVSLL